MKYLNFVIVTLILLTLATAGCSNKTSNKIIGKWKADSVAGFDKSIQSEIFYEFTKDSMIAYGSVHSQPLDRISMPYKIKSEEKDLLTIEATQLSSGQTGDFKISLNGPKMSLTDPRNNIYTLTKQ